jgi:hypothetical protein
LNRMFHVLLLRKQHETLYLSRPSGFSTTQRRGTFPQYLSLSVPTYARYTLTRSFV